MDSANIQDEATITDKHSPQNSASYSNDEALSSEVTEKEHQNNSVMSNPTNQPHTNGAMPKELYESLQEETKEMHVQRIEVDTAAAFESAEVFESGMILSNSPDKTHGITDTPSEIYVRSQDKSKEMCLQRALVDTAAPFESVKEAVSKFGGITDWKAHKLQTIERHKAVEIELERLQQEIPQYKTQFEAVEADKIQIIEQLNQMNVYIEEIKHKLEKAEMEASQAKQDLELVCLRVEERKQGIAHEASVAAKAELDIAKSRHEAARLEIKSVKEELEALRGEYNVLIQGKNLAVKKAEAVVSVSNEVEKTVEEMTLDLIMAKQSLESAHAAHLEVEEERIAANVNKMQEEDKWEKEVKGAKEGIQSLHKQIELQKETQSKLESSCNLLHVLKSKIAAETNSKTDQQIKSHKNTQSAMNDLEDVRSRINSTKEQVKILSSMIDSLTSELEGERAKVKSMKARSESVSIASTNLEAELKKITCELQSVQLNEKGVSDKMALLPGKVKQASQEADLAKSAAKTMAEQHIKIKEEAEQAKAKLDTCQSLLHATLKEEEAARVSERLAISAIKALHESESAAMPDSPTGINLPVETYFELTKHAHDAEKHANMLVANGISRIEAARDSKWRTLEKLQEALNEVKKRKEEFKIALEKAEKANQGKLHMEQELRKWREEHEERRRANDSIGEDVTRIEKQVSNQGEEKTSQYRDHEENTENVTETQTDLTRVGNNIIKGNAAEESEVAQLQSKKKRSFFPRIVMFLARRKVQAK